MSGNGRVARQTQVELPSGGACSRCCPMAAKRERCRRLAHADWSGYSVSEDAFTFTFTRGHGAGLLAAAALAQPGPGTPCAHLRHRWQHRRIPPSLPALARNPANNETWVNSRHRPSMPGDMAMRQTELHLTDEDRAAVDEIRRKGRHHASEVNRAHVLHSLDRGVPEAQIMAVLGLGRTVVWRTRLAYLQGGIDLAVFDLARPGRPRQYGTDDEARVMALACSAPPAGQKRWTLAQLECAARQEPGLGRMGRETVRRILRKTTANPGAG